MFVKLLSLFKKYHRKKRRIICLALFLVSLITPFIMNSFGDDAQYEYASFLVTEISKSSITGSANFDAQYVKETSILDLADFTDKCIQANYQRNAGSYYNFRVAYNSKLDTYLTLDDCEDLSISILPHTSSGSPHKNAKEENVHAAFEIKLMFDSDKTNRSNPNGTTYVYLRKTVAKTIMEKLNIYSIDPDINDYSLNDYEHFKNNYNLPVTYRFNGLNYSYKVSIANIIIPNEGYDEFFTKTFGEYITMCTNSYLKNALPSFDGFSVNFDFGSSTFETTRYFKIINSMCNVKDFKYQFNLSNVDTNFDVAKNNAYSVCSIIADNTAKLKQYAIFLPSVIIFAAFVIVFIICNIRHKNEIVFVLDFFSFFVLHFLIYSIFFLLSHFNNKMILFFSTKAIITAIVFTVVSICAGFLISLLKFKQQYTIDKFYEIQI